MEVVPENNNNKREKSLKRWTNNKTNLLLDYLQFNLPFEDPSPRIYYSNFLRTSNIHTTWSSIRWKVRNLRLSLKKANELLQQSFANAEASFQADPESVHPKLARKINRICPYYNRLVQIFGNDNDRVSEDCFSESEAVDGPDHVSPAVTNAVSHSVANHFDYQTSIMEPVIKLDDDEIMDEDDEDRNATNLVNTTVNTTHNVGNMMMGMDLQMRNLEEIKMKLEEVRLMKKYDFEEKKLKLEEMKMRNKFDIRKLEIEMNERLARYRLDLKYKPANTST